MSGTVLNINESGLFRFRQDYNRFKISLPRIYTDFFKRSVRIGESTEKTNLYREDATFAPGAHLPRAQVPGSAGEDAKIFKE